MLRFKMVAACASNGAIGRDGGIPWKMPTDLKYFKKYTTDTILVMGRKTWESLPGILPGRPHCVITSNAEALNEEFKDEPRVTFFTSFEEVKNHCMILTEEDKMMMDVDPNYDAMKTLTIIGGAGLYNDPEILKHIHTMLLTKVDVIVEDADTFLDIDQLLEYLAPCETGNVTRRLFPLIAKDDPENKPDDVTGDEFDGDTVILDAKNS